MSTERTPYAGEGHRRERIAWVLVIGLTLVAFVSSLPRVEQAESRPIPRSRRNLRDIAIALAAYESRHGVFPFDSRGPEYALYALSNELPASKFDGVPNMEPTPEARWDHVHRRIEGADFEYLNPPTEQKYHPHRIVLADRPDVGREYVRLSTADGTTISCRTPKETSRDLLGNWLTSDRFLIRDRAMSDEWEAVPLPAGPSSSTSTSQAARGSIQTQIVSADYNGVHIDYEYDQGQLVSRTLRSAAGVITDRVTTDEYGRIVTLQREPGNWKDFWPVPSRSP